MKERPILFSAPMVRATLRDVDPKTQTRRLYKIRKHPDAGCEIAASELAREPQHVIDRICPYGRPGDRLWVKEAWQYADWDDDELPWIRYRADGSKKFQRHVPTDDWERLQDIWAALSEPGNHSIDNTAADRRWRPSIHMFRWASRITLEITGVRVERLQDISEHDAIAEGIAINNEPFRFYSSGLPNDMARPNAVSAYCDLWEGINGLYSWDANPWVWVVEFRSIEQQALRKAA